LLCHRNQERTCQRPKQKLLLILPVMHSFRLKIHQPKYVFIKFRFNAFILFHRKCKFFQHHVA
jgi:hypothetical protein